MKSSSPYAAKLFAEDRYLEQELKTRQSEVILES